MAIRSVRCCSPTTFGGAHRQGGEAEAGTWVAARDAALADSQELLRATWRGLPVNEQKMALALARRPPALHHQATLDAVGLKKGSVMRAVEGLLARGDAIAGQGVSRV